MIAIAKALVQRKKPGEHTWCGPLWAKRQALRARVRGREAAMSATKLRLSCPSMRPPRHSSSAAVPWLRHHGGGGGQGERGGGWGIATHIEFAAGTGVSDSRSAPRWGHAAAAPRRGALPPLLTGGRESPPARLLSPLPQEAAVARWGKPKGSVGRSAAQRLGCGLAVLPPSRLPGPSCWPAGLRGSRAPSLARRVVY